MKERLDVLLVQRGLADSREKAKALIMAGSVLVNGQREDKAGTMIDGKAEITVKGNQLRYVSRGGLKLEKAMKNFGIVLAGRTCMDVGASTGGFTDCMLQNGAAMVYSVDVGHGQLDWKLRNDARVVCMEKTNIRYVVPEDIQEPPSFVSIDVSFISLTKVLGPVRELMTDEGELVCLIKPQFEAGREKVGKKGVVRDPAVHEEVIRKVIAYAGQLGFVQLGLEYSPIKGPEGNIEYLLYLRKHTECGENNPGSAESGDAGSINTEPGGAGSMDAEPGDAGPINTELGYAESVNTEPGGKKGKAAPNEKPADDGGEKPDAGKDFRNRPDTTEQDAVKAIVTAAHAALD